MTFTETTLGGAFIIDIVTVEDERGFFSRTWSPDLDADSRVPAEFRRIDGMVRKRRGSGLRSLLQFQSNQGSHRLVSCMIPTYRDSQQLQQLASGEAAWKTT